MRQVVLDTDILSEIIKQKDAQVLSRANAYALEYRRFTFTAVTAQEIVFGLESRGASKQLETLKNTLFTEHEIVVPTLEDYLLAGEVRGKARRMGRQIALDDCLIATASYRLGLPISTGNTEHFREMQQAGLPLEIENWREPYAS
jgi:predicted nucleic acid-binding protein